MALGQQVDRVVKRRPVLQQGHDVPKENALRRKIRDIPDVLDEVQRTLRRRAGSARRIARHVSLPRRHSATNVAAPVDVHPAPRTPRTWGRGERKIPEGRFPKATGFSPGGGVHRGKASRTPPSTVTIQPLVFAERFDTKKHTASATSST